MLNHMLPVVHKHETFTYSVPPTFRLKYKELSASLGLSWPWLFVEQMLCEIKTGAPAGPAVTEEQLHG